VAGVTGKRTERVLF